MKRTLCILLSLMLAVTGLSGLLVPAAAEDDSSPYIAEDFEGTYSIGRWVYDPNGGMQRWESEPGDYDLVTGHYCNGDGSSRDHAGSVFAERAAARPYLRRARLGLGG